MASGVKLKRIGCLSCPGKYWDSKARRCSKGYGNPISKKEAGKIAELMGAPYVCPYNREWGNLPGGPLTWYEIERR